MFSLLIWTKKKPMTSRKIMGRGLRTKYATSFLRTRLSLNKRSMESWLKQPGESVSKIKKEGDFHVCGLVWLALLQFQMLC